jgi:hypothetical protein
MNIIISLKQFDINSVFFLDTKKNIIINGYFTKIIYSNSFITLNGIYIKTNFILKPQTKNMYFDELNTKNNIYFQPHLNENYDIIKLISNYENDILQYYKNINKINNKTQSLTISKQINTGLIKLYKDNGSYLYDLSKIVLKISGVWENNETFGLTYKFFC